eukprot:TRINITY_DN5996_c0_g1_i1.p1 TRINITY_DN5996_c0_g1~~TRINITY_DN5996_c0_g1_i1.p1  ORF type:complete len:223 (+),score=28.71 TRINITY_DN5996_c0_g1_i1:87-755(+)
MCKIDGAEGSDVEYVGFMEGFGWICTRLRPDSEQRLETDQNEVWRCRAPCFNESCEIRRPLRHGSAWKSRPGGVVRNSVRARRTWSGTNLEAVSEEGNLRTDKETSVSLAPPGAMAEEKDAAEIITEQGEHKWEMLSMPLQEVEWETSSETTFIPWDEESVNSDSSCSWVECPDDRSISRKSSIGSFVFMDNQPSLSRGSSVSSFVVVDGLSSPEPVNIDID